MASPVEDPIDSGTPTVMASETPHSAEMEATPSHLPSSPEVTAPAKDAVVSAALSVPVPDSHLDHSAAPLKLDDPVEVRKLNAQLEETLQHHFQVIAQLKEDNADLQNRIDAQANHLVSLEKAAQFAAAAKSAVEKELAEERNRRMVAEDTVEMLRGKLEDSRKAITTLNRRSSGPVGGNGGGGGGGGGLGLLSSSPVEGYNEGLFGSTVILAKDTQPVHAPASPSMSNTTPTKPIASSVSQRSGLRDFKLGTITSPTASPSRGGVFASSNHTLPEPGSSPFRPARSSTRSDNNASREEMTKAIVLDDAAGYPGGPIQSPTPTKPTLDRDGSRQSSTSNDHEQDGDVGAAVLNDSDENLPLAAKSSVREEDAAAAEALKAEVTVLKARLAESQFAREASERALKALREFMSTGAAAAVKDGSASSQTELVPGTSSSALVGIKLPPLPTDEDTEEEEEAIAKAAAAVAEARRPSTWRSPSFSMWKSSSTTEPPTIKRKVSNAPSFASPYDRKVSLAPSITPSLTPSNASVTSDSSSSAAAPMSPPISEAVEELPETPSLPSGGLGSFVASWSKGITNLAVPSAPATPAPVTPAIEDAVVPVTPEQQGRFSGPAVKRAFSFFSPGTSRGSSVSALKLEAAAEVKELEEKQRTGPVGKAVCSIPEVSELQEAGTPKAPSMQATFNPGHGYSPSDLTADMTQPGAPESPVAVAVAAEAEKAADGSSALAPSPFKDGFSCIVEPEGKEPATLFDSDDEHADEAAADHAM